ncbi:unnamed protein product (macronuclear) [Paramecium tetraurelia]|uniref:RING-type domain-containing protein n=1 Tax=Paramecium tetraurelia TaxID=5888 RepID=A0CE03_PARTE|nr:uncharacterized protein GSPATT00007232001 [Paramecium tetraurelia]CAK69020.1 unnamed protein product [Paramecium tetraurelia]|eukprot:XP_001436417.1 hypothetical protein (macronuclear) [Paramecium tetraurelia strain d4-2]
MIQIVQEGQGKHCDQYQINKKDKNLKLMIINLGDGNKLLINIDKRYQQKLSNYDYQLLEQQLWQTNIDKVFQKGKGVPKKLQQKLRKMKMGKSNRQCSICCNNFSKDETIIQLPCKHIFHQSCLFSWLDHSTKCPNCRSDVLEGLKSEEK